MRARSLNRLALRCATNRVSRRARRASRTGPQEGPPSAGYLNDHCRTPRLQCRLRKHATDRTIGRNAGNPSPSAAEAVIASSSRAAMSGSRARHQRWSRAFLMGSRMTGSIDTAQRATHRTAALGVSHPTVAESRRPPESGVDASEQQFSNACMRFVHPVTSHPLATPRCQPARRMLAPSRLPSVYSVLHESPWRRLLRALRLGR